MKRYSSLVVDHAGNPVEEEYLFTAYSIFTVRSVTWGADGAPHCIELYAASDNRAEAEGGEPNDEGVSRPVLLLNLTEAARQLESTDLEAVRSQFIATLHGSFYTRSAQLLASGLCHHSDQSHAVHHRVQTLQRVAVLRVPFSGRRSIPRKRSLRFKPRVTRRAACGLRP